MDRRTTDSHTQYDSDMADLRGANQQGCARVPRRLQEIEYSIINTNQDTAGGTAGDFKAQFIKQLAEFPVLKTFFETLPGGIRGDPGILDLLVDANPAVYSLLSIL